MEKPCQQCGELFRLRTKTQKFCSTPCLGASQRAQPKVCPMCSTVFQPKKGAAQKFCSPECLHRHRMEPKGRTCVHCGAPFQAHTNTSKFCSLECRQAEAKVRKALKRANYSETAPPPPQPRHHPPARGLLPRPCDCCGVVYTPSHTYQQFCGVACKNTAHAARMKGAANSNYRHGLETDFYSREFKRRLNKEVRARYGECFQCGAKTSLCAHHMDEDKTNNAPKNLACLCHSCHTRYHKLSDKGLRESMTSLWKKTIASWPKGS